jgi:hypothetical protein
VSKRKRCQPSAVSIAELADWVAAEGKCSAFFDFHIDLEQSGSLLCLRLTGLMMASRFSYGLNFGRPKFAKGLRLSSAWK